MHMNGRRSPTIHPPDTTAILVEMSGQIGEIRGDVKAIKDRQRHIERTLTEQGRSSSRQPLDWVSILVAAGILAAAAAGKVTWADALPSVTKLVGH